MIYYTVNTLYFDDNSMNKIYETKSSFNLVYELQKMIYSSLISMVLNIILKLLVLSNNNIIKFKNDKTNGNFDKRNIINILIIKFVLYFLIIFVFFFFLVLNINIWSNIWKYSNSFIKRYFNKFCIIFILSIG